mgnify:CR=1 FL=1
MQNVLLSDEPLNADSETAIGTLDMLDDEAIDLFKSVDVIMSIKV